MTGQSPPSDPFPPYVNRLPLGNRLARLAWGIAWRLLFRPTPAFMFAWRRLLLRAFGARIGSRVHVHPSCRIWAPWNLEMDDDSALAPRVDCYNVASVRIGKHATISQDSLLCTAGHDLADPARRLTSQAISIADGAWIFARAFLGPGVTVGEGAAVAACAVVVKDVPPWTIVGGNPAREIGRRELRESPPALAP